MIPAITELSSSRSRMPFTRLRVKDGAVGALPYLSTPRKPGNANNRLWKHLGSSTIVDSKMEGVENRVHPLGFYALKILLADFETAQVGEEDSTALPDLEEFPRIPFVPSAMQLLYPDFTLINTSPLRWAVLCRLFTDLPDELRTFYLPLSDPYILPLQRWSSESRLELQFLTTVSLGRSGCDKAIPVLSKLKALVGLDLSYSQVTVTGIRELSRNCIQLGDGTLLGPWKLAALLLAKTSMTASVEDTLLRFKCLQYVGKLFILL